MFWADKLTQSKPMKSQKLFENGEFALVHLSQAVVDKIGEKDRVKLIGKQQKGEEIILATLSRANDTSKLDVYINCTQSVTLSLQGGSDKTEVHLSGYFEPKGEDMDDDMFYGEEEDEDLDEDEEEEAGKDAVAIQALHKSLKEAKANSNKNASNKIEVAESDDDDEEDSDEKAAVASDSDEEEEDDASSDEEVVVPQKKAAAPQKKVQVVEDSDED
jgi:nucleophosmin 1